MARVLLVDDSMIVRELLSALLSAAGFEVTTAETGESALELHPGCAPDVVICDLQMPGIGGLEVVEALYARDPLLPTLILTEQSDVGICVRALRSGAVGYVLKGMTDDLLLAEVQAALDARALKVKNAELERANQDYRRHLEDMVAQKTAEVLKLQSMKNQAERMAALGTLVAGVAHEVNNPLAVVKSNLAWLSEFSGMMQSFATSLGQSVQRAKGTAPDTEEVSEDIRLLPEVVSEASKGVERIMGIVKALRRISNPSAPGGSCQVTDALVDAEHQAKVAAQPNVIIERSMEAGDLQVALSREDVTTVLAHLLTNAVHALPQLGGTIRIRARRTPVGNVELVVADTGSGIPAELVDRVCEPFFTTKDPGKGIGLGLTLVRQVVTGHGGSIRIESEAGQGTQVVLELPPPPQQQQGAVSVKHGRLRV